MLRFVGGIAVSAAAIYAVSLLQEGRVYTLYRSGVNLPNMRIHVATFDASDGSDYNHSNCVIASELFLKQPGVEVRYWCEKGVYRK